MYKSLKRLGHWVTGSRKEDNPGGITYKIWALGDNMRMYVEILRNKWGMTNEQIEEMTGIKIEGDHIMVYDTRMMNGKPVPRSREGS